MHMETILHKASSRGFFDHGWLRTYHTFSFADYRNPERVSFGALRVLNDDTIAPETGFGLHPHHNMEIVSMPLRGALEHRDNMGNRTVIRAGELQVMSAGKGVLHSEYNESATETAEFLQIWVIPDRPNVTPRYENGNISHLIRPNEISVIVSPFDSHTGGLWIYQQAWFSVADMDTDVSLEYVLRSEKSYGVYAFVLEGNVNAAGVELDRRDGLGITDTARFDLRANGKSRVLLIEVPPYEI